MEDNKQMKWLTENKVHLMFYILAAIFIVAGFTLAIVFGLKTGEGIAGLVLAFEGKGIFIGILIGTEDFKKK